MTTQARCWPATIGFWHRRQSEQVRDANVETEPHTNSHARASSPAAAEASETERLRSHPRGASDQAGRTGWIRLPGGSGRADDALRGLPRSIAWPRRNELL